MVKSASKAVHRPVPVLDTLNETLMFYQAVQQADNPRQHIQDWLHHCLTATPISLPVFAVDDYRIVLNFLYSYRGSPQTFTAYRRDLERLIQWSWFIRQQSLLMLNRTDMEAFIAFCAKPYKRWIGTKTVARFILKAGRRIPNPQWRPFDLIANQPNHANSPTDVHPKLPTTTTSVTRKPPNKVDYRFSQKALKALFAILGSFYQFCLQEEVITANPVALIRQKSKFLRQEATTPVVRRLSNTQWRLVMHLAQTKAKADPQHGRTVFILSCLYGMYLRISELTATARWTPTMGDFFKDHQGNWWFNTVGKGNKARQIAVSADMLMALKHYRTDYLQLPPYPVRHENTPLIGHLNNPDKPMTDARTLRRLVQTCFDAAADQLRRHDPEGAENLSFATVHWLRHTGISEDVKHRPREHVRDDAGHSSSAITDRYIDVELAARAASAKSKRLLAEES